MGGLLLSATRPRISIYTLVVLRLVSSISAKGVDGGAPVIQSVEASSRFVSCLLLRSST